MIILAFFFAAVSGYLVGIMGSSNNPISGLTLTALVVTALIMVILGAKGNEGVASTLGVAAVVCVSAAVAGEMLQDLKAGHILGGTPWRMQVGDIVGVVIAGSVMFFVLSYLNQGDINTGRCGRVCRRIRQPETFSSTGKSDGHSFPGNCWGTDGLASDYHRYADGLRIYPDAGKKSYAGLCRNVPSPGNYVCHFYWWSDKGYRQQLR